MRTYIGTKNDERVFITWELKGGNFSASGEYWNRAGTDLSSCGQCIDTIAQDFPDNAQAQDILNVWQKWHLNDMKEGSPMQEQLIRDEIGPAYDKIKEQNDKLKTPCTLPSRFDYITSELLKRGRLVDPDYIVNGLAYTYGSSWLKEDIPARIIKKIRSWVEVPAPDEPSLIESFCNSLDIKITFDAKTKEDTWECNKWNVLVEGEKFDYFTGLGIATAPEPKDVMASLLRDARIGQNGLASALDDVAYLGFEGKELVKVARACVDVHNRLTRAGAYNEGLAQLV